MTGVNDQAPATAAPAPSRQVTALERGAKGPHRVFPFMAWLPLSLCSLSVMALKETGRAPVSYTNSPAGGPTADARRVSRDYSYVIGCGCRDGRGRPPRGKDSRPLRRAPRALLPRWRKVTQSVGREGFEPP